MVITGVDRIAFSARKFAVASFVRRITLASAVRASSVSYTSSAAVCFVALQRRASRIGIVLWVRGTCAALSCASVGSAYSATFIGSSKISRAFRILKSLNYIIVHLFYLILNYFKNCLKYAVYALMGDCDYNFSTRSRFYGIEDYLCEVSIQVCSDLVQHHDGALLNVA